MPIVQNINKSPKRPRILVAPLDWGLGHAARCVPIIRFLLDAGTEVNIASSGPPAILLQNEFPGIRIFPLKGYGIRYQKGKGSLVWQMIRQVPRILSSIRHERRWLNELLNDEEFDAVISDNRYGLNHPNLASVFITHQLKIQSGNGFTDRILQHINYRFINRFSVCWVPDAIGKNDLAGELSHPTNLPKLAVKYIGHLSRFKVETDKIYSDLLVLISGPEPQRSVFEQMLLNQFRDFKGKVILVRGLPGNDDLPTNLPTNVECYNHLPAQELNKMIQGTEMVIARSGYSTVMDLNCLAKKAILVPTPGQSEQEYLASYLEKKGLFFTVNQNRFSLGKCLAAAKNFPFNSQPASALEKSLIVDWLNGLRPVIQKQSLQ